MSFWQEFQTNLITRIQLCQKKISGNNVTMVKYDFMFNFPILVGFVDFWCLDSKTGKQGWFITFNSFTKLFLWLSKAKLEISHDFLLRISHFIIHFDLYRHLLVLSQNSKTMINICSDLTIKIAEPPHWHLSGVFIVTFEQILHIVLVFLLLNSNK